MNPTQAHFLRKIPEGHSIIIVPKKPYDLVAEMAISAILTSVKVSTLK